MPLDPRLKMQIGSPEPLAVASATNPVGAVADDLTRLADRAADPSTKAAFRRASRALFQQPGGRRPINDRRLLEDIEDLIAAGVAKVRARCVRAGRQRITANFASRAGRLQNGTGGNLIEGQRSYREGVIKSLPQRGRKPTGSRNSHKP